MYAVFLFPKNMRIFEAIKEAKKYSCDNLAVQVLFAEILNKTKEYLISHSDEDINNPIIDEFYVKLERLKRGEPLAYIINKKEFYGLDFFVDKRVLIPRPETEHIIDKIIELSKLNNFNSGIKILDVGTGSGNIAVSLANNIKNALITAVDISDSALEVAKINIKKHGFEDRIEIFNSDILEKVNDKFDVIVANLPYIGIDENNYVAYEVKNYEPHVALYGGQNGMGLYEKLFLQINEKKCLNNFLLGEIGFSQKYALEKLINKYFPKSDFNVFQDLAGFDRYFVVNYSGN